MDESHLTAFATLWTYDNDGYVFASDLDAMSSEHCAVLQRTFYKGPGYISSYESDAILLSEFLKALDCKTAKKQPSERGESRGSASSTRPSAASEPWVVHLFEGGGKRVAKHPDADAAAVASDSEMDDFGREGDEVEKAFVDAAAELEEAKTASAGFAETPDTHFRQTLLGGAWQVKRTGRAVYGLRADVKQSSPLRELCRRFSLGYSVSCEYNRFGERVSADLVHAWQQRLVQLEKIWSDAGKPLEWTMDVPPLTLEPAVATRLAELKGAEAKRRDRIVGTCPVMKRDAHLQS
eukprot:5913473-Amphidinium_carterae.1